ncbi:response regulator [Cohnella sp.]|uniref:response regulator n=1 Tax=Cohnella sp. TaxID=1883426 RepID=UPI003561A6E4
MLVDDEPLALAYLEKQLSSIDGIQIAGAFTDPAKAVEFLGVSSGAIELALLDIEMPGRSGLELAHVFQQLAPDMEIAFVTAYNEFAIEAFELHSIDYLLKPVTPARLRKTVDRARRTLRISKPAVGQRVIRLFDSLRLEEEAGRITEFKWRTAKTQELFTYLCLYAEQPVHRDMLLEVLWSDTPAERAATLLHTTVYQIRKMLKSLELPAEIHFKEESYTFRINGILIDALDWERKAEQLRMVDAFSIRGWCDWLRGYPPQSLTGYSYEWLLPYKQRCDRLWLSNAAQIAEYYESIGQWEEAIDTWRTAVSAAPQEPALCLGIMKAYERAGRMADVLDHYEDWIERCNCGVQDSHPGISQWFAEFRERLLYRKITE